MSNITYNPSIDIPPYHEFGDVNDNTGSHVMNFPSDGNFKHTQQINTHDVADQRNTNQYRREPRYESYNNNTQYDSRHDPLIPRLSQNKYTRESVGESPLNWILLLKKLAIYTILFLVMSHIKLHELVCNILPFFNNNEVFCMAFKGLVMAIIITVLLPIFL